ncbi:hypothetical protein PENTCL1PPCAC_24117, partial [Pristionchus entomophagus]
SLHTQFRSSNHPPIERRNRLARLRVALQFRESVAILDAHRVNEEVFEDRTERREQRPQLGRMHTGRNVVDVQTAFESLHREIQDLVGPLKLHGPSPRLAAEESRVGCGCGRCCRCNSGRSTFWSKRRTPVQPG